MSWNLPALNHLRLIPGNPEALDNPQKSLKPKSKKQAETIQTKAPKLATSQANSDSRTEDACNLDSGRVGVL